MTTPDHISTELVLWLIGGACAVVSALLVYIFSALTRKVQHIEDKLEAVALENHEDHQKVVATLARVEQAIIGIDRDVQRHDREIGGLAREVDEIRNRRL